MFWRQARPPEVLVDVLLEEEVVEDVVVDVVVEDVVVELLLVVELVVAGDPPPELELELLELVTAPPPCPPPLLELAPPPAFDPPEPRTGSRPCAQRVMNRSEEAVSVRLIARLRCKCSRADIEQPPGKQRVAASDSRRAWRLSPPGSQLEKHTERGRPRPRERVIPSPGMKRRVIWILAAANHLTRCAG